MKIAITGGAGFIGSHMADCFSRQGGDILILDDFSSGRMQNLKGLEGRAKVVKTDIRGDLAGLLKGADAVFHFAADPDARQSAENPESCFDINVRGTLSVLESCRKADVKRIVFASTSAVYGAGSALPSREDFPCAPSSNYGASKLACEGYLSSYSSSYGIKSTVLRLANIIGERSTHGVVFDFFKKLKSNPNELEILGDGKQSKSYLHVSDCISAAMVAFRAQKKNYDVFNVGSREQATVDEIARKICKILGVAPKFAYTGGLQGWKGDNYLMMLDNSKIMGLGWEQKVGFDEAISRHLAWLG